MGVSDQDEDGDFGGWPAGSQRVRGLGQPGRRAGETTPVSHVHYDEGGSDFRPGEYSETYVYAGWDYADILDALRNGRIFVTLGDLIDRLDLTVRRAGKAPQHAEANGSSATVGETLTLHGRDRDAEIEVRVREPRTPNAKGQRPHVNRIDIITGRVTGPAADRSSDTNPTTAVAGRYGPGQWRREGDEIVVRHTLRDIDGPMYVRARGTNTDELEPQPDPRGSDPWSDLWFYSNPVFISR
ncbi:hypothetical protein [Microbispora sp. NBRC 16548]|uniref:hypothetical protein n=1 Tax=Microbispora sp. NBRC 16548 TaxID=3030994 RepID=UPI0024A3D77E|nr:hypothetical protein [Microbispora sp. NBRC 16548]GLX11455.1 hypothetical protein Misp03_83810 [Microbispora sp. NBRC 16548]